MKFNWKLQNTKTKMSTAKNRNHTRQQIQILLNILSVHLLYLQLLWDFCFGKLHTIDGGLQCIHVLTCWYQTGNKVELLFIITWYVTPTDIMTLYWLET